MINTIVLKYTCTCILTFVFDKLPKWGNQGSLMVCNLSIFLEGEGGGGRLSARGG